jgi:hypothetical protein
MRSSDSQRARVLAIFDKRFEGDDALLRLASLRFRQSGLGPEFYAETPSQLDRLLTFSPAPDAPATVHLPRDMDLFQPHCRNLVIELAETFRGRIYGMVVHDQAAIRERLNTYVSLLNDMDSRLAPIQGSPYLFIEYTSAISPELFLDLFRKLGSAERIGTGIDTGHLGLKLASSAFSALFPGRDIYSYDPYTPGLHEVTAQIQGVLATALEQLLDLIGEFGHLGKHVHFHLHDAHPLSTSSPFGIRDHLSFLSQIPIPFDFDGRQSLRAMYGPRGLRRIVRKALDCLGSERTSFCLEIHPAKGRLPLGDASGLFQHWIDKTNAERMNFWLSTLARNYLLIADLIEQELPRDTKRRERVSAN